MQVSETLSLKETPKGKRTFIKNKSSIDAGFIHGKPIDIIFHSDYVEVVPAENSKRKVAKGNIIDIQSKRMNAVFPDVSRVNVIYQNERILLTAHYSETQVNKRESAVRQNKTLKMGELFAGSGSLGLQIKRGLNAAGVKTQHAFSNELSADKAYLLASNDEIWDNDEAKLLIDDIMTMDLSTFPLTDILVIGYPCVGFSQMQTNKSITDLNHPQAGVLFVRVLDVINRVNPSVIIMENSPNMAKSDTMFIMDAVLNQTGYKSVQGTLKGHDFGDFEPRERMIKVYYSHGLSQFDLSTITPDLNAVRNVNDILEPSSVREADWKPFDYLKAHSNDTRHGHKFHEARPNDTKLKTFGANYGKAQPDSSFLAHEDNAELHRLFTPQEHANIRRFSEGAKKVIHETAEGGGPYFQRGSRTRAHRMCGDSITPLPWLSAGKALGQWLLSNTNSLDIDASNDDVMFQQFISGWQ